MGGVLMGCPRPTTYETKGKCPKDKGGHPLRAPTPSLDHIVEATLVVPRPFRPAQETDARGASVVRPRQDTSAPAPSSPSLFL